MSQDHFEGVLLEEMRSNFRQAFDGLAGIHEHLSDHDRRFDRIDERLDRIETDVAVLKTDVAVIKTDIRDIKRGMGVLQSIANDHEGRLQGVENMVQDHLAHDPTTT